MSALAELLHRRGARVTGCDANPANAPDLHRLGISVVAGHDPAHADAAGALVVTSAMPREHPELVRARERGIPVIRREEALSSPTPSELRCCVPSLTTTTSNISPSSPAPASNLSDSSS